MKTLEELMNKALVQLDNSQYSQISEFITDDHKSAEFIRSVLDDPTFAANKGDSITAEVAQVRARHSAVAYLMGLALHPFYRFEDDMAKYCSENMASKLWLLVSLNHDRGYFSDRLKNDNFKFDSLKYRLFTDDYSDELAVLSSFRKKHPDALAYTYDEIAAYDQYARKYHMKGSKKPDYKYAEHIDHGILGGTLTFNDLISKSEKSYYDLVISKYCGLTIAQHNIFKSNSEERDAQYSPELLTKLGHKSPFRISKETPLLLFLCLIDTVEAVKKFSKSENDGCYLETLTTLRSIKADVKENELTLDLTELYNQLRKKKKNDEKAGKFTEYQNALKGLKKWTNFCVDETNDSLILKISYQETSDLEYQNIVASDREVAYA